MPEVGVSTLSFHPWDMSAGTLVSELVPDDRSEVLPQTPGRGSLPAAGGPSPEDCSEATPGGGGAGRMEEGHRAVRSWDHPPSSASPWGGGASSQPALCRFLQSQLCPPEAGLRWGLSQPGLGLGGKGRGHGQGGCWLWGRDPVRGWLVCRQDPTQMMRSQPGGGRARGDMKQGVGEPAFPGCKAGCVIIALGFLGEGRVVGTRPCLQVRPPSRHTCPVEAQEQDRGPPTPGRVRACVSPLAQGEGLLLTLVPRGPVSRASGGGSDSD